MIPKRSKVYLRRFTLISLAVLQFSGRAVYATLETMGRAILIIGAGAALIGIIIYALIDCARTPAPQARSLPKPAWLAIILLFPVIGALLWLLIGRPRTAGGATLGSRTASSQTFKAPDDDEEYLRFLDAKTKRQRASQENQRSAQQNPQERKKPRQKPTDENPTDTTDTEIPES
jgi:hypothetical protein